MKMIRRQTFSSQISESGLFQDVNALLTMKYKPDTVSMSLYGSTNPVTAALHIVLGDRLDVDVVSIHSKERLERFVMSMLSYGYLGDLMKHSEG